MFVFMRYYLYVFKSEEKPVTAKLLLLIEVGRYVFRREKFMVILVMFNIYERFRWDKCRVNAETALIWLLISKFGY